MNIGLWISICHCRPGGGASPPTSGALEVDGFQILVDTYPIIFA